MAKATPTILKRLYEGQVINLPACDGRKVISKAKQVFSLWIDHAFCKWGADDPDGNAPAMPVAVYEMVADATFQAMFESLSADLDSLCMTGAQIREFCRLHRDKLQDGQVGNFFLKKSRGRFFVVIVGRLNRQMQVAVEHFDNPTVNHAKYHGHVVVLQAP